MRYIYQEPVISTISDDEMTDEREVKGLLDRLKAMQHGIYMEFEDVENPEFRRCLDNVRIIDVSEATIDIHAFSTNASVKYRKIPFNNIRKIRILASKQAMSKKYKVTRWHMMDVAEVGE